MMKASFRVDLNRIRSKVGEGVRTKAERITQQLVNGFIRDSPRWSGAFQASWNVSEGTPIFISVGRGRKPDTFAAPVIVVKAKTNFPVFFITNGQPYAQKLEYGWSDQAPMGIVRVNIASLR